MLAFFQTAAVFHLHSYGSFLACSSQSHMILVCKMLEQLNGLTICLLCTYVSLMLCSTSGFIIPPEKVPSIVTSVACLTTLKHLVLSIHHLLFLLCLSCYPFFWCVTLCCFIILPHFFMWTVLGSYFYCHSCVYFLSCPYRSQWNWNCSNIFLAASSFTWATWFD